MLLAARWTAVAEDGDAAILAVAAALPDIGITPSSLWRPFEDQLADSRCLHLFGTAAEFSVSWKPRIPTGSKSYYRPKLWSDGNEDGDSLRDTLTGGFWGQGPLRNARRWFHSTARGLFARRYARLAARLFAAVDLLLPNSNMEAQRIARRANVPAERWGRATRR